MPETRELRLERENRELRQALKDVMDQLVRERSLNVEREAALQRRIVELEQDLFEGAVGPAGRKSGVIVAKADGDRVPKGTISSGFSEDACAAPGYRWESRDESEAKRGNGKPSISPSPSVTGKSPENCFARGGDHGRLSCGTGDGAGIVPAGRGAMHSSGSICSDVALASTHCNEGATRSSDGAVDNACDAAKPSLPVAESDGNSCGLQLPDCTKAELDPAQNGGVLRQEHGGVVEGAVGRADNETSVNLGTVGNSSRSARCRDRANSGENPAVPRENVWSRIKRERENPGDREPLPKRERTQWSQFPIQATPDGIWDLSL